MYLPAVPLYLYFSSAVNPSVQVVGGPARPYWQPAGGNLPPTNTHIQLQPVVRPVVPPLSQAWAATKICPRVAIIDAICHQVWLVFDRGGPGHIEAGPIRPHSELVWRYLSGILYSVSGPKSGLEVICNK